MNDSQRINNWLTLVSIVIISGVLSIYSKYIAPYQQEKSTSQAYVKNSPCKKNINCSDKIYSKSFVKEGLSFLQNGEYTLNGGMILNINKDINFTVEQADKIFLDTIDVTKDEKAIRRLNINYEIIEDDKQAKRAFLMTSFRINNNHLYRIKVDLDSLKLDDIKKGIELTIESFRYNAKI